ncbi:MAG: DUF2851 family protein [Bacteroidales bacterium]|jgi:hypothetical protein|nr:DUF2851 family protein [Bacteroidales bacterium]
MSEQFLYYLWQNRLICGDLTLTDMRKVEILYPGSRNSGAGPDFFNARIKIERTEWAGNVEMHLRSSDWELHKHHQDKNYDNVILHVVLEDDQPVSYSNGEPIPTLVCQNNFDVDMLESYERMIANRHFVPCAGAIAHCDDFVMMSWLENIAAERLIMRQKEIEKVLEYTQNDWNRAYYVRLCRNFGFKVNAEPFELLETILPLQVLLKNNADIDDIEALVFGAAGFLEKNHNDEYPRQLRNNFLFFKRKYEINPMEAHLWKFMRVYPGNFPTIRLSQFAQVAALNGIQFSNILGAKDIREIKSYFRVSTTPYWETHYQFDKTSWKRDKKLGNESINLLLINTILPFVFAYGRLREELSFCEKAIELFQQLPPENNYIIRKWKEIGVKAQNAMESQALLHLKEKYCNTKRCLQCRIGDYLLRVSPPNRSNL